MYYRTHLLSLHELMRMNDDDRQKETENSNTNAALNLVNSYDTFTDTFTPLSHLCVFLPRAKSKGRECLLERNN